MTERRRPPTSRREGARGARARQGLPRAARDRGRHRRGLPVPRHLRVPRRREAARRARAPDHAPPGGLARGDREEPARHREAQGQARLDRSRHPDDGVDRREGGGRARRAPAHRAGVHQPPDVSPTSSRSRSRPIRRSATAASCPRRRARRASRGTSRARSRTCRGCDRLHRAQLDDTDNPYNTYQHEGLPPGPIANPGRRSIEAAISPDGSDYLFFVAKNDREHVFSKTVDEHERAVTKYQR